MDAKWEKGHHQRNQIVVGWLLQVADLRRLKGFVIAYAQQTNQNTDIQIKHSQEQDQDDLIDDVYIGQGNQINEIALLDLIREITN